MRDSTDGIGDGLPAAKYASHAGQETFDWPLANSAEALLRTYISEFLARNRSAQTMAARMRDETGTDFFEWLDHLVLPETCEMEVREAGFCEDASAEAPAGQRVFECPRATVPRVILQEGRKERELVAAIKPEWLAEFLGHNNLTCRAEGEPLSQYRQALISNEHGTRFIAVERRAYRGFISKPLSGNECKSLLRARELCLARPRCFPTPSEGFLYARTVVQEAIELVGPDVACQFFFEGERAYWQQRNHAAQVQKARQDLLGLGWGNHDHHTFRCSREHFVDVVEILGYLGFHKRERYYAGAEAGWGAQIMEQPVAGIVVFADVDLQPEETRIDFSTTRLPGALKLGTVGLWAALHGESFLDAGMHHLEARFDFDLLRDQLAAAGIGMMKPFSNFEFLRQAFTEGQHWPVRSERIQKLRNASLITADQAEKFAKEGALGSHLENLQRHGGFKGFNQKAVSVIISATDPRNQARAMAAA